MKWLSRLMVPAAKPSDLSQQHMAGENTPNKASSYLHLTTP